MPALLRKLAPAAVALLLVSCEDPGTGSHRESDTKFRFVKESVYNLITVERDGDIVDMKFRLGKNASRQTAVNLADPMDLVIPYTRAMLLAALVQPEPKNILQIGLGGGGLNRFLRNMYPQASLTTVELDKEVLTMAERYMGFRPDERDRVLIDDGRASLKKQKAKFDWIFVDAFRGGYVPAHLKTKEFYEALKGLLAEGGVVALNVHGGNRLYESDEATLQAVFPEVHVFPVAGKGNVVILASISGGPRLGAAGEEAAVRSSAKPEVLRAYLSETQTYYNGRADGARGKVLTDDFAPAEILDGQRTSAPAE
jgi:spermidine synthase